MKICKNLHPTPHTPHPTPHTLSPPTNFLPQTLIRMPKGQEKRPQATPIRIVTPKKRRYQTKTQVLCFLR
ncbi:MAG: hypothetical protein EWV55_04345 [Microcystis viridis Mv_BB_P_19951000_S69]|uniref:Uncharacterized protein n=1 Tax=Microcystis viridis Mv_BB_P_19951000_S68D TaxID=2486270 RepID=A0A552I9X1_MICVR|nr:MAG: hypothetical protein EWV47_23245 [Microcystis viridis Mv_BB_P_19951000_S68]TRU77714.1 MAG: hypothetical protein EWV55_04345 [Microcystis viridis Mv_BB_P_19951000_S69]TRU80259.1 MAG: hypothetical protein EWV77_00580 [Microcystis viridis Mv_BB_P_19951000_S68D]TRU86780.1 MAG: hypothetical protein EWV46_09525 [Microcystis viridis Mv_BB_P_19951000_S69D]